MNSSLIITLRRYWIIVVLFAITILYFSSLNNSTAGDSKVSVILAESLANGTGFRDISDIRMPLVNYTGPLFPLSLASFSHFTDNLKYLKIIPVLGIISSFLIFLSILKKYYMNITYKYSHLIVLFAVLNPFLYNLSNEIGTHSLFLLLSMITVYYMHMYEYTPKIKYIVLLSLFASLSFLTRWVGLALFIGPFIYLLLSRRFKDVIIFTFTFSILSLPWIIYTAYLHFSGKAAFFYLTLILNPYGSQDLGLFVKLFSIIVRFARTNGGYFFRILPSFLFGSFFENVNLANFDITTLFKMIIGFIPSFIIVRGFVKDLRFSMFHLYICVYLVVLGMFAEPDIHYIAPVSLFIYLWGYRGAAAIIKNLYIRRILYMIVILTNIIVMSASVFSREHSVLDTMNKWIISNTTEDDVFLVYKWFSPIYIYTKRHTIARMSYDELFNSPKYIYEDSCLLVDKYKDISYVLVSNTGKDTHYLESRKSVKDNPEKYIAVYSDVYKTIYKVKR